MYKICLFADDAKTAEYLVTRFFNDSCTEKYVGVALYPEALSVFRKYSLKSIILDDYITAIEHGVNGSKASDLIFQINKSLGFESSIDYGFSYENYDLLYGYQFINYLIIGDIYYLLTTISNFFKENKVEKIYAVDLRKPIKFPIYPRVRGLLSQVLLKVSEDYKTPIQFVQVDSDYEESIQGSDVKKYNYRNINIIFKVARLFDKYLHKQRFIEVFARYSLRTRNIKKNNQEREGLLFVGTLSYFYEIIQELRTNSINRICLDHSDSLKSYYFEKNNLIITNLQYIFENFCDEECKELIDKYSRKARKTYELLVKNNELRNNFQHNGVCYYDILLLYIKSYVETGFVKNLKVYLSVKEFAKKYNIKFALGYCGWTLPPTFSILEALKANKVPTAYFSHGLNVANKKIAPYVKGDGTLLPCDVLFAPGSEFIKGHVESGLKDKNDNYLTGYPFYKRAKKAKTPLRKYFMKKMLELTPEKKIILYPLKYGAPHLDRPNSVTFVEECEFLKKTIEVFKNYEQFQFVVKSKQYTVPDKTILNLFHDNYPHALLAYGNINHYLSITDVVINFNSSCGFDALLAGIPVIYKSPNGRDDWFESFASKHNEPNYFLYAEKYEDIPKICNNIINGKFPEWYKDKMAEVPGKFLSYTGNESAKRIVNIINDKYLGQCL